MRILVLGKGGRESSICDKLAGEGHEVICAPGNPGIEQFARIVPKLNINDPEAVLAFVVSEGVEFTVVGGEDPLNAGVVNRLTREGHRVFGPTREAAQIECDKAFAATLMILNGIPHPKSWTYPNFQALALQLAVNTEWPSVIKAAGPALGKGVEIVESAEGLPTALDRMEALKDGSGKTLVGGKWLVQEHKQGAEMGVFVLTDSKDYKVLASTGDYKRLLDGNNGPNTGGMGGFCPHPLFTPELQERIERDIVEPLIQRLGDCKVPGSDGTRAFRGVLYIQLMITLDGPVVIEVNCRFGDPEAQMIMSMLDCDLLPLLLATTEDGVLAGMTVKLKDKKAVNVVLAAANYGIGDPKSGDAIAGLTEAEETGAVVYHAGTKLDEKGQVVTGGGRVITVVGIADSYKEAKQIADTAADIVQFDGKQRRRDIAEEYVEQAA